MEYHKIEGPFKREAGNPKKVDRTQWRNKAVEALKDVPIWRGSEKIDGTNVRINWDGHKITFGGRTDKAVMPKPLTAALEAQFHAPGVEEVFEEQFGNKEVVLYGEGYGPKIQGGGKYRDDVAFIGFDIQIAGVMLDREDSFPLFKTLNVRTVTVQEPATLTWLIQQVEAGLASEFGDFEAEGFVAVTEPELRDRHGERIIVKLKSRDLKQN